MYVCGMTVYDYCHIGHARMMMAFDVIYRWLRGSGYEVKYVRNITDIDDKIIKRAVENGEIVGELTARFNRYMDEDTAALGIRVPERSRARPNTCRRCWALSSCSSKRAWPTGRGGRRRRRRQLRGAQFPRLRQSFRASRWTTCAPANASTSTPASATRSTSCCGSAPRIRADEVSGPSKWGSGRPGWHIECSAMSCATLGEQFDIHGGGAGPAVPAPRKRDRAVGRRVRRADGQYWIHNGFVRVDNEKMSKSLGNFFTIRDVLKKYDAEVVRFFILRAALPQPAQLFRAPTWTTRAWR